MTHKPSRFVIPGGSNLSLDPDVFPILPGQEFIANKTPEWKTSVTESTSGRETRRPMWSFPKWKFELSYDFLRNNPTNNELNALYAFFNSHLGQYQEFLFFDPEDNYQSSIGVTLGNGVNRFYSLTRTISAYGKTATEPVRAFYGNPVIRLNGVATTAFTINPYGVIEFTAAPGNGVVISWEGQFFFVCRFDVDELSVNQMMSRLWAGSSITFRSIKP